MFPTTRILHTFLMLASSDFFASLVVFPEKKQDRNRENERGPNFGTPSSSIFGTQGGVWRRSRLGWEKSMFAKVANRLFGLDALIDRAKQSNAMGLTAFCTIFDTVPFPGLGGKFLRLSLPLNIFGALSDFCWN